MVGKLGTRASSEDDVAYDGQRLGNQTQALLDAGEALLERGARRCRESWLDRHLHHGRHSSTSSRLLSAVACPNAAASSEVAPSVPPCAAVEQWKCHGESVREVTAPGALGGQGQ